MMKKKSALDVEKDGGGDVGGDSGGYEQWKDSSHRREKNKDSKRKRGAWKVW